MARNPTKVRSRKAKTSVPFVAHCLHGRLLNVSTELTIPNTSLSPCRRDKAEGLMHQPPWVPPHLLLLGGKNMCLKRTLLSERCSKRSFGYCCPKLSQKYDTTPRPIVSHKSHKASNVTRLKPAESMNSGVPHVDHKAAQSSQRNSKLHLLEGRAEWPHDPEYLTSNVEMHVARCCDAFPSIEKVPRVKCPTLVIHGTDDEDYLGAGHNDVELHAAYLERLRNFIDSEARRSKDDIGVRV
ncbi:hypothetical protein ANCCEY_05015 [Ancylostoma ceylanicum]|uniref:Peptidase S9 prolyl oligopeptidase catalytic domain-containing protein n=1 Tax=Ancylostoma ceylanicum TaxID=53326 RepID=A0A0D6LV36_9BILA|nr:hypothetical protein ANCCEY_05015 [Ancylostoma ceylanicum]